MNTASNTSTDDDAIDIDGMEKAASGGNRPKYLPFKDGTNVYRILPPFGKIGKEKGFPYAEIFLHWWKTDGDKAGFPVRCTKKTDDAGCPICDEVEKLQAELDVALRPFTSGAGDKKKVDWDSVPSGLKSKAKRVKDIGWQRHYYYNAVSLSGEVGVLKIPKTLGDKLNAKLRECVKDRKFNPVSKAEGVFFIMTRSKSATGRYDFEVDLQKKTVKLDDGDTAEKVVKSPLAPEIVAKLDTSMRDLYDLFRPQTAATLKKAMSGEGKSASMDFNPADFADDEEGSGSEAGETKKADSKVAPDDIAPPDEDDVDALAAELGVK